MKTFFIGLLLYTIYSILYTTSANASGIALGVNPTLLRITTKVPSSIREPITITNHSDTPIELTILLKPFIASGEKNGEVEYLKNTEGPNPKILENVVILDGETPITSLTLSPRQEKTIVVGMDLKPQEPPSDYYFSVVFVSKPNNIPQDTPSASTNISAGVASNILLSVNPSSQRLTIEKFFAPILLEKGPVSFTLELTNRGEHVTSSKGSILITNMFGQQIGKIKVNQVNILKNSARIITPEWNEGFLLGLYKAELQLDYNNQYLNRTIYFFALPYMAVFGLALTLLLLISIKNRVQKRLR